MKRSSKLLATLMMSVFLVGCSTTPAEGDAQSSGSMSGSSSMAGSGAAASGASSSGAVTSGAVTGAVEPITFIDQYEFEVTLPEKIERVAIVQLLPLPAVMAAYQGGDVSNIVCIPPDSLNAAEKSILADYSPEFLNIETDPLKGGQINLEELLALEPDVVLYSGKDNHELFTNAGLVSVGFNTAAGGLNPNATLVKWIEQLEIVFQQDSKLQGVAEYTEAVQADIDARLATLTEDEKKKVMIIGTYNEGMMSVSGFSKFWIPTVGGIDVAAEAENGSANLEQVYEWDPDVIFVSSLANQLPEDFYNNTANPNHDWSVVTAVKENNVHKFPVGIHRWWPPTPEGPLSLYWQASLIYPELFEDLDLNQITKDYFNEYLNYDLTDEQVAQIYTPVKDMGFGAGA